MRGIYYELYLCCKFLSFYSVLNFYEVFFVHLFDLFYQPTFLSVVLSSPTVYSVDILSCGRVNSFHLLGIYYIPPVCYWK